MILDFEIWKIWMYAVDMDSVVPASYMDSCYLPIYIYGFIRYKIGINMNMIHIYIQYKM